MNWDEASEVPRVFVEQWSAKTFRWLAVDVNWKRLGLSDDFESFADAERAALETYPNARFFSSGRRGKGV